MDFIKEKKISVTVIDTSLFHIGCAYFVQHNDSCFTGILCDSTEEFLLFTMVDGKTRRITVGELGDPKNVYKITLLVPDDIQRDLIGYIRYMNGNK